MQSTARSRLFAVFSVAFNAFLVLAGVTAATTIARNLVLQPAAVVTTPLELRLSSVYDVTSFTRIHRWLVPPTPLQMESITQRVANGSLAEMPRFPPAFNYYYANGLLESNVELLSPDDPRYPAKDEKGNPPVPPYLQLATRHFDRLMAFATGAVNFRPCWDWSTKAIYVSLVARYKTTGCSVNEVTFADAVIRDVSVPSRLAPVAEKRHEGVVLTEEEAKEWEAFEESIRHPHHDHPSVYIDHVEKTVTFKNSMKYYLDDFYSDSLPGTPLEVVVRYQVMSYSGWAPLREDAVNGRVRVVAPTTVEAWK